MDQSNKQGSSSGDCGCCSSAATCSGIDEGGVGLGLLLNWLNEGAGHE